MIPYLTYRQSYTVIFREDCFLLEKIFCHIGRLCHIGRKIDLGSIRCYGSHMALIGLERLTGSLGENGCFYVEMGFLVITWHSRCPFVKEKISISLRSSWGMLEIEKYVLCAISIRKEFPCAETVRKRFPPPLRNRIKGATWACSVF